jgi:mRNA interferase MazF
MDLVSGPRRDEIWLVGLDPTIGAEIRRTRPAVVVSPDVMNRHLRTVIIAPMTSVRRGWPTRLPLRFESRDGEIALDQLRAVDQDRLLRRLGALDQSVAMRVADVLTRMLARG